MGTERIAGALAGAVVALGMMVTGCGTSAPEPSGQVSTPGTAPDPAPAPPPIRLAFGDCAGETAAFVTGPRPDAFEREEVAAHMAALAAAGDETGPDEQTAESAGVVGVMQGGTVSSLNADPDAEAYGGLLGGEVGEMQGGFGSGVSGFGPGGGGTGWGTIGTGGLGGGSGYGTGGAGRGGMRGRKMITPIVNIGNASATGDLDKTIIRRYIRRKLPQIKYCYEKQLLVKPELTGTVVSDFVIGLDGKVASSTASGVDSEVSSCVAKVISGIQFPKPKGGGVVKVRYPFTFRTADDEEEKPQEPAKEQAEAAPPAKRQPDEVDPAPSPVVEEDGRYLAGQRNPLRDHAGAIERCLRGREPGVGVVELAIGDDGAVTASEAFGFGDAAGCVTEAARSVRWADGAGAVHRCSVSYGTREPGAARGVDITAAAIQLDGEQVVDLTTYDPEAGGEELVRPVYRPLDAEQRRLAVQSESVVVDLGPLIVRPVDATPMAWVYRIVESIARAEAPWLLAVQDGRSWRLLRPVVLPVVPVPLGTGELWNDPTSPVRVASPLGTISLEVGPGAVQVALSPGGKATTIPHAGGVVDQDRLRAVLDQHRKADLPGVRLIDIGAGDAVRYRQVARAIETAQDAGFTDWTLVRAHHLRTGGMLGK